MNIKSARKPFHNITFGEGSFDRLLDQFKSSLTKETFHLCLFVGKPEKPKQEAIKEIAEEMDRDIKEIDANEIVSKIESETYKNIEHLFAHFSSDNTILYIKNGGRFSGSYTAYTNSKIKYATPQERYFLNKMQETTGLYVVDLNETIDGDTTLHRAAESVVSFPTPQSMFRQLMWKFKNITVHGHEIETKRPERYREQVSNF